MLLLKSLCTGRLSGAALDVMETEPLPSESPPHLASFSREASAQLYQMSAAAAAALLQRQWIGNYPVNPVEDICRFTLRPCEARVYQLKM